METFIRKEIKYKISDAQKKTLFERIAGHIEPDLYPDCNIYSLYLDTDQMDLMRICEGKPEFRQKVRIRSYQEATHADDPVFLELKKKSEGICFKCRSEFTLDTLGRFLQEPEASDQTRAELSHVLSVWPLQVRFALYAHRRCWIWKGRPDLRMTVDDELTWRDRDLYLGRSSAEQPLLEKGQNILEIKCAQNLPRELVDALFETSIVPASFSKAGQVYQRMLERKQTVCRTL